MVEDTAVHDLNMDSLKEQLLSVPPSLHKFIEKSKIRLSNKKVLIKSNSDYSIDSPQVTCLVRARIPTNFGSEVYLHLYENNFDNKEHLAIVFGHTIKSKSLFRYRKDDTQESRLLRGAYVGKLFPGRTLADKDQETGEFLHIDPISGEIILNEENSDETYIVRIHSECFTGENVWSSRCDCGEQLNESGKIINSFGKGCVIYLRQEGRGIGLCDKLKAYNLQDLGADTVQANLLLHHKSDSRNFSIASAILHDLSFKKIKLLTNNPKKIASCYEYDKKIEIVERIQMTPLSWKDKSDFSNIHSDEFNKYLMTKINKLGHLINVPNEFKT